MLLGTGLSIAPRYWNAEKGRAKRGYIHEATTNAALDAFELEIVNEYHRQVTAGIVPTPATLKEALRKKSREVKGTPSISDVLDGFIRDKETTLKPATLQIYTTLKGQLKEFSEVYNVRVTWETLDLLFFQKFVEFLMRVKGNNNQTLDKTIQRLRAFLRHCDEVQKIPMCRDYLKFTAKALPKGEPSRKVYLTERELETIELLDLSASDRLRKVRDVFLFLARTGLRYGDCQLLRIENVRGDHFKLTTTKNRKTIRIPIHPTAERIWKMYEGNLPKITNQRFDAYLKEVCQLARIEEPTLVVDHRGAERIETTVPKWQLVAAHTGKRSFITNLLLAGVSIQSLCEITGNTADTIEAYIVPTGEDVRREVVAAWGRKD